MAVTKSSALNSIIKGLEKQFSKANMVTLGLTMESNVEPLPTGSITLDQAIGIGGLPVGRCVEIFGPNASGKTSLSLYQIKNWQDHAAALKQEERYALLIDLEKATTRKMLDSFGIDQDRFLHAKPDTAEEALTMALKLVESGEIGIMVLDSIDALQTEQQLKREVGDADVGGITKPLNFFIRQFSKVCPDTNTTAIFINQIRFKPGVSFGDPQTTPGGEALKFYCSLRLETMLRQDSKFPNAFKMRIKIIKNRFAAPRKDPVEVDFFYMKGIDPVLDLITFAKERGAAVAQGRGFKAALGTDGEMISISNSGQPGALQYLRDNPSEFEKLKTFCLNKVVTVSTEIEGESDED